MMRSTKKRLSTMLPSLHKRSEPTRTTRWMKLSPPAGAKTGFRGTCGYQKLRKRRKVSSFEIHRPNVAGTLTLSRSIVSVLACRFRSRAVLELATARRSCSRSRTATGRAPRAGRRCCAIIDRLRIACVHGDADKRSIPDRPKRTPNPHDARVGK